MKIERIEPAKRVRKPKDVAIGELKLELSEARRQILALKKEVKAEQAHATGMLASMEHMSAIMADMLRPPLRSCRCSPTRAEMIARGRW